MKDRDTGTHSSKRDPQDLETLSQQPSQFTPHNVRIGYQ